MRRLFARLLTSVILAVGVTATALGTVESDTIRLTILYDNCGFDERLTTEWGFSCLIEGLEQTILLDAGGEPLILRQNMNTLDVEVSSIDAVVLSHGHWDHYGGLSTLIALGLDCPLYVPANLPAEARREIGWPEERVIDANGSIEICANARTTGQLLRPLPEHGLVLRTSDGLVIITGCAHPGIVEIVEKAIEAFPEEPVDLVLGGLHLGMATVQEVTQIIDGLRTLGVRRVAPSHCTGDRSKSLFALAFGDDFIDIGAGAVLEFAP